MSTIKNSEIQLLQKIMGHPPRNPRQLNHLNEADAEIVRLKNQQLVITQDILADEIHWGLYRDPRLVGWMSVVCSLSDLAVTGALPLGILLGTHWGPDYPLNKRKLFFTGVNAALQAHQTFLLGGDTSQGTETVISSTAVGVLPPHRRAWMRGKIKVGDRLFAVGQFGAGPALSLRVLLGKPKKYFAESHFRPQVTFWKHLPQVRAAIDVSDGLASSLCILSQLNQVSFDMTVQERLFTLESREFCQKLQLPISALFFAEHGDYQPIFVVPAKKSAIFQKTYPQAVLVACATPAVQPHRILNRHSVWKNIQLDMVFNANKSDLHKLQVVFEKWVALARQIQLP